MRGFRVPQGVSFWQCMHRCARPGARGAGLSLELELVLAIKCGALRRGHACLAALLSGCADRTLLSRFAAWNNRDKDPDAPPAPEEAEDDADPFGKGAGIKDAAAAAAAAGPTNVRLPRVYMRVTTRALGGLPWLA